jgi:hypothetical protein
MAVYRLRKGYGKHYCADGHCIDRENPVYETNEPLAKMLPDKFELVTGVGEMPEHPYGDLVTVNFPLAGEIPKCYVWKKGRRYRIQVGGVVLDTGRLTNEDEVNAQLKKHLKTIQNGEVEDLEEEEDEPEEVEEDEESEDEEESDSEDDEEDEAPARKRGRPAKKPRK